MKKKIVLKILIGFVAIIFIALILINSKIVSNSALKGLYICLNVLIPSMLIFLIVSDFCQRTNVLNFVLKPLQPIFTKFFKVDKNLTSTIFFSLIGGYPTGAYLISNWLENKQISKETAARLLCFCVNSGPAFLIGAISVPFTGNIFFGMMLFISQIVAFFLVGTLCSIRVKTEEIKKICVENKESVSQIFVNSINRSIRTMAVICGFTILFSAIIGLLFQLMDANFQNSKIIKAIISGFLEVTNGITTFNKIENLNTFLTIALISSFGGLCVHFQIRAILSKFKISMKKFYVWRLIYCFVSLIICYILFKSNLLYKTAIAINKVKPEISNHNLISSIGLIILSVALLYCDKKNIIIKKN